MRMVNGAGHHLHRGFALLEWLVALTVTIILLTVTLAPLRRWWLRMQIAQTEQRVFASLAWARAESIRLHIPVGVCRAGPQGACSTAAWRDTGGRMIPGHDWGGGWLVVAYPLRGKLSSARRPRASVKPRILRSLMPAYGTTVVVDTNVQNLTFRPPTGQAVGYAGTLRIVPSADVHANADSTGGAVLRRCIKINMVGRPRSSVDNCR